MHQIVLTGTEEPAEEVTEEAGVGKADDSGKSTRPTQGADLREQARSGKALKAGKEARARSASVAASAAPTRTRLSAEERRAQILDIARDLFITRGYHHTSTDDILARAGIAKGTLYHHFTSKEAILNALVLRTCDELAARAAAVARTPGSAIERFIRTIGALNVTAEEGGEHLVNALHATGNADYHLLSITETIARIAPILTGIVEEGVAAGEFTTPHPMESVELILLGAGMLLDQGIFPADEATRARRTQALILNTGRILGCDPAALAAALDGQRP